MAADGILIGLGILAGVALGWPSLLMVAPMLLLVQALQGRIRVASLALMSVCVLIGALRSSFGDQPPMVVRLEDTKAAIGVVESMPVAGGTYERSIVRISDLQYGDDSWGEGAGTVLAYFPDRGGGVSRGDQVFLAWEAASLNHLSPGYASFVHSLGASGSATIWTYSVQREGPAWLHALSDIRRHISDTLAGTIEGDAGALAAGIVTGHDSGLSAATEDAFRRTGTAHITAVSGQNIALLASFLALWFRPGRKWCRLAAHAAVILGVWTYAAIVGLEPPALRAASVATLMIIGAWFGRKPDPLTILALTLGSMAIVQPRMVGSVGFWLSAAASWALCSSMPTERPAGLRPAFRYMIASVMAANVATLPIIIWTFGEWSPISPVANLLVGLVMAVTFSATYGLALMGIISPVIAAWAAWIPAVGLDLTIAVVERLAPLLPLMQLPIHGPSIAVVVAAPCFAALALLSRDGRRWINIVIVRQRSHSRVLPSWIIVSGALVGGMAAVLLSAHLQ